MVLYLRVHLMDHNQSEHSRSQEIHGDAYLKINKDWSSMPSHQNGPQIGAVVCAAVPDNTRGLDTGMKNLLSP